MARKDELGRWGEEYAARYLCSIGYTVLRRNWRSCSAEVDVVALDDSVLVVCEVKTRRSLRQGHPSEAVDATRIARLAQAAEQLLIDYPHSSARIDVISITTAGSIIQLEHSRSVTS